MRAVFPQSSLKLTTMNSTTKLSLARLYSTRPSARSSRKNHYNTLNITPHATHSEVKSAYYKLSLQYHPDKNKSEYAKQKFQDISDAYEVLGNHETRKNYDRQTLIRQQPVSDIRESTSQYSNNVYSGTSRIYNFDEWTQAHYGEQFRIQRLRRDRYRHYKEQEELHRKEKDSTRYLEFALFFVTISVMIALFYQENFDVPVSKTRKSIEENETRRN